MIIKGHFISSTHFIKSFVSQRFSRHARVRGHENRTVVQDLSSYRSFARLARTHSRGRRSCDSLLPLATVPRIVYSSLASVSIWFRNSTQFRRVLQPDLCCFPLCLNRFSSRMNLFECSTIVEIKPVIHTVSRNLQVCVSRTSSKFCFKIERTAILHFIDNSSTQPFSALIVITDCIII